MITTIKDFINEKVSSDKQFNTTNALNIAKRILSEYNIIKKDDADNIIIKNIKIEDILNLLTDKECKEYSELEYKYIAKEYGKSEYDMNDTIEKQFDIRYDFLKNHKIIK